ncbi:MAG: hypothetical protein IPM56_06115 [Ignavibacteriales bacterium]|nr:MAG: hypothetical protein IPM56_06115 [Ignavibacteriales bacterium]
MKIFAVLFLLSYSFTIAQSDATLSRLQLEQELKSTVNADNQPLVATDVKVKKSAGLAIIYSLLLPGMGELYSGSYSSGKYFTIAEGGLWLTYIGMNSYGNWQKDRYVSFAASNGGVNTAGKDEDYFATISEYISVEQYNREKALERNFSDMLTSPASAWDWKTNDNRRTYRGLWVSSEQAYNNLRFIVGAMLVNRIASAINAVRLVASHNKQIEEEVSWGFSAGVDNPVDRPSSFILIFHTAF